MFTAVDKLDMVINDINDILRVNYRANEKKESVQFGAIIDDIKLSIANLLDANDVTIECNFEVTEILTIKSYLYSIFFNLISNSIKYGQPAQKTMIRIATKKVNNTIEINFRDNGIGFDVQKHRENLFRLYKRFHNHKEGKGMGLYMVKTQVETLGGRITVDSKIDVGTTFKIVFEVHE